MLKTDDLRNFNETGSGCSAEAMLKMAADELDKIRAQYSLLRDDLMIDAIKHGITAGMQQASDEHLGNANIQYADETLIYEHICAQISKNDLPNKSDANSASIAAIQYALTDDEGITFLRLWNEGEFDAIRKEWPDAPEAIFIGADPLYKEKK